MAIDSDSDNTNAEYNWLKALTDGPYAHRTNSLALLLTLDITDPQTLTLMTMKIWEVEPPPHIDYLLVQSLAKLAHGALLPADLARLSNLTLSRKYYFRAHLKYQGAYRALADVRAYGEMLDAEKKEMEAFGEERVGQWVENERQTVVNEGELKKWVENMKNAEKVRDMMTVELGRVKRGFVDSEVHRLVYVCRHLHKRHQKSECKYPHSFDMF